MRTPTTTIATTAYEIRVAGHLDDHWATWLDHADLVRHDDGTTVLTAHLADQSQLHGLLARIRDLSVPLLALRTLDAQAPRAESPTPSLRHALRTERLTLRPGCGDDADATWTYRTLDSVGEWLTEPPAEPETYRATFAEPERLAATVIIELGGHVIGDVMLRREAKGALAELGWVLDPGHTGQGYATEAVRALLEHCFTSLGVRRVVATCFLADDTSWRLMERVGMRREGHAVAESRHRSGRWLDTVTYAVLADDWSR